MDTQQPKGFIESPLYEKNKNKITTNTKLLDEILNGVTFAIALKPDAFPLVDNQGTRTAKTTAPNFPDITIFFKEFDRHIVLVDIQPTPVTADDIPF